MGREDLDETEIYKNLVEPSVGTAGGHPWAILVGLYDFDAIGPRRRSRTRG